MLAKKMTTTPECSENVNGGNCNNDDNKVTLSHLSELTGFPMDFIKKELMLKEGPVSLSDLRAGVMSYLEATNLEMGQ